MRKPLTLILCVVIITLLSGLIIHDQRMPVEFVGGFVKPAACLPKDEAPALIQRGGCINVGIVLTWRRVDCDLDVARMIRDGRGWDHKVASNRSSVTPQPSDVGKPLGSSRTVAVAPEVFPGPDAHYRATMKLSCGWLRKFHTIVVEVPPLPFEIAGP